MREGREGEVRQGDAGLGQVVGGVHVERRNACSKISSCRSIVGCHLGLKERGQGRDARSPASACSALDPPLRWVQSVGWVWAASVWRWVWPEPRGAREGCVRRGRARPHRAAPPWGLGTCWAAPPKAHPSKGLCAGGTRCAATAGLQQGLRARASGWARNRARQECIPACAQGKTHTAWPAVFNRRHTRWIAGAPAVRR